MRTFRPPRRRRCAALHRLHSPRRRQGADALQHGGMTVLEGDQQGMRGEVGEVVEGIGVGPHNVAKGDSWRG